MVKKRRILLLKWKTFSPAAQRGHEEYAMKKVSKSVGEGRVSGKVEAATMELGSARSERTALEEAVRSGAKQMLQAAIDAEVVEFLETHRGRCDGEGRRQVVRNGSPPAREVMTGIGMLEVRQPRIRDKSLDAGSRVVFSPSILPPYLRRAKAVEELVPWLYLRGISTQDFPEAIGVLLGEETARGLSPSVIVRLKEHWFRQYEEWCRRDLSDKRYVYLWADGIHVNVRLEGEGNQRQCLLVLMGALEDGTKELIAVIDGYRESEQSWKEVLVDLKQRGLEHPPLLAVGDGALGFWAALRKVFPTTKEQRCWVHKTANVLNKLPKGTQARAKADIHEIWMSDTKADAEKAFNGFLEKYGPKYGAACDCLRKDRDMLMSFYAFPAEHWRHLRTSNPIESAFATIRLRHRRTKGCGSRNASLAMMFKLAKAAEKRWRRLNGHEAIVALIQGKLFNDGVEQNAA